MKRYFLLILQILFEDLLDTDPVSGSGSAIQISCIEHNLDSRNLSWVGQIRPVVSDGQVGNLDPSG